MGTGTFEKWVPLPSVEKVNTLTTVSNNHT